MNLLTVKEASLLLGISHQTLKRWIARGKIRNVKTAGGHYRIPQEEVIRQLGSNLMVDPLNETESLPATGKISGRNQLSGNVLEVLYQGLFAQIKIDIGTGQIVTSIITSEGTRGLGLRKGLSVVALIKATDVMVIRD